MASCHTHATLCQSSHRFHRIHRSFWCRRASHGFHRCSQIRRVWHSCHTHATLCQSSHRIHRIHRSFWRKIFSHRFRRCTQIRRVWHPAIPTPPSANSPTEFAEPTEISGVEEPPTDFADAHRLGGYGIPAIPTPPSANSPTEFTEPTETTARRIFSHRFHRCPQIRRVWHPAIPTPPSANPPTDFTEFTEASGVEEPPTDFTDAHRWLGCVGFCGKIVQWAAWVWQGCHTLLICAHLCNLWENFALLVQLGQLHPLVGRCKKCIDFFVVTKFRCIFAM